jgi:hypothetical protein
MFSVCNFNSFPKLALLSDFVFVYLYWTSFILFCVKWIKKYLEFESVIRIQVVREIVQWRLHVTTIINISRCGVRLIPLGTSAIIWHIVPAPDGSWWVWSSRWSENWQGKPKYWRKPAPVSLSPPQIPHDLDWISTRAAAVGSWRLTTWAMVSPWPLHEL